MQTTNNFQKQRYSLQNLIYNDDNDSSIILLDQEALKGSRDFLYQKSKPIVDVVFSPFEKRYAVLTGAEKKSINSFIKKIDPRCGGIAGGIDNDKISRALLIKEWSKTTEDDRIDPRDAKKYLGIINGNLVQ